MNSIRCPQKDTIMVSIQRESPKCFTETDDGSWLYKGSPGYKINPELTLCHRYPWNEMVLGEPRCIDFIIC